MVRASRLPGIIGECAENVYVLRNLVNEAQERLLTDPLAPDTGWWGGHARMVFNATVTNRQAYITTPQEVARLTDMSLCSSVTEIKNDFYEFQQFGTGLRDATTCCGQVCRGLEAFERDNVPTLTELIGTKLITAYMSDDADAGQQVVIQGLDQNGFPVTQIDTNTFRTTLGEHMFLTVPLITSANQFKSVTGIMKNVTLGRVDFIQTDPTTGEELPLSSMEPGEITANYRRYFLSGLPTKCYGALTGTVQVTALAKLDLVPVLNDQDYLLIQSIPAILEECQALRYGSMDSPNASKKEAEHHTKALRLLFGQLDHFYGKTTTTVKVPIFGSDRLTRQPL